MFRAFLVNLREKYGVSIWRMVWRYWLPHWVLGFLGAVLVYWLTLTMLLHISGNSTIDSSIRIICGLLALSFSVVLHCLEDLYVNWF